MWFSKPKQTRIYLDYAAATPVRPEVLEAMMPFFSDEFANPSAIHAEGQRARLAVEAARADVAKLLQVRADEVTFTASGTESNNLAIVGIIEAEADKGVPYEDMEIITTAIEHPSVLEMVAHYAKKGVRTTLVSVGEDGVIDVANLAGKLSLQTKLVTVAYVNSEIGTIAPVRKIVRAVEAYNTKHDTNIVVHLDAAQAPLWLPCSIAQLGVDLISLDTGKCYGPKGVGILARKHGVKLVSHLFGGGQEHGLRPGTENTALIVGAAKSLQIACSQFAERAEKVAAVRDYGIQQLTALPGVVLNGSLTERVANNINVSVAGVEAEFAAVTLDTAGIACSTKSACGSGKGAGSSVIRSITGDNERALTSLRFTLGEATTTEEIDTLMRTLSAHITSTRTFMEKLTRA